MTIFVSEEFIEIEWLDRMVKWQGFDGVWISPDIDVILVIFVHSLDFFHLSIYHLLVSLPIKEVLMVSLSNRLWYFTLLSFELYGYFLGLESRLIERCKEWLILLGRLIQIIVGDPTRSFIIILLISPDLPLSLATFLPLNGINLQIQVFKINTFGQYLILSLSNLLERCSFSSSHHLIIEIVVHYGPAIMGSFI